MEGCTMMTTTTTDAAGRPYRPARRSLLALAIVGVGVLAFTGLVVSQRGGDEAASTSDTAVPAAPPRVTAAAPSYTVYLTDSAEQATALAQNLARLTPASDESIRGEVLTLAAGSIEEHARAQQIIGNLEDLTNGQGVAVVDVRRPASTSRSSAGGSCESGLGAGASDPSGC